MTDRTPWLWLRGLRVRMGLGLAHVHDVASWRRWVTVSFHWVILVALPLGIGASIPVYLDQQRYGLIVFDAAIFVWVAATVAVRRGPLRPRPIVSLSLSFLMSTVFFVSLGPHHARSIWLVLTVSLAAVLYGNRGVIVTTVLNVVMLWTVYLTASPADLVWAADLEAPVTVWVMFVTSAAMLGLVIGLPTAMLLTRLEQTMDRERKVHAQLVSERSELERAYDKLRVEVDQRRRLQVRIKQAERLEAMGRLAGGIAHDLNNVLTPVVGYSDLLLIQGEPDEGRRQFLERIREAGERGRDLVEQVLLFSRGVPRADGSVRVDEVAMEVMRHVRPLVPEATRLELHLLSGTTVRANHTALYQVVLNLVTNGLAAMEGRAGALTITTEVIAAGDEAAARAGLSADTEIVCLRVRDEGAGIDPGLVERIFEPYFTTKPHGKGTGLGLAICHGIVTGYGGTITVESEPGQGSTLSVWLPRDGRVDLTEEVGAVTSGLVGRYSVRVLLVDDNRATRETIRDQLILLGCTVVEAGSGEQAMEVYQTERRSLDLVVTDLHMSGMTGLELIAAIRREDRSIPVVLISGHIEHDAVEHAMRHGVEHVLSKPCTVIDLSAMLELLAFERSG